MKTLFNFMLLTTGLSPIFAGLYSFNGNLTYGGCRPPDDYAFDLRCPQDKVTWIQQALFGAVTDQGALSDFCNKALPNRTTECIPDQPTNTRNIRLACNTVRGQCKPQGSEEEMHANTFISCPQTRSFTYAFAIYDCLPAYRSTDGGQIDYIHVDPSSLPRSSTEKVYLMSTSYESKGYTTSTLNQCTVTVSSSALSAVRFTVLDLYGQSTSSSGCPYSLTISSTGGNSNMWCVQPTWNFFVPYVFEIPANSGTQQTVSVSFNAASDSVSPQGRFWILVEGITSDGTASSILVTTSGLTTTTTSTSTTTTTTTTPTTTTTTTPTTTPTTTTTTTTTPTTTSTSTTTTTTTPTTTTTTPTSTTIRTTPASTTTTTTTTTSSTPVTTPSPRQTATSTATSTTSTTTRSTTTSSTSTTKTTIITSTSSTQVFVSPVATPTPPIYSATGFGTTRSADNSSGSTNSSAGQSTDPIPAPVDQMSSSRIVAIAVGVSVGGVALIFLLVPIIVCLCLQCSNKRRQRKAKIRPPEPAPAFSADDQEHSTVRSPPPATVSKQTSVSGTSPGVDEIYSEINEASIGVTIIHTGTMKSNDPSSIQHQVSVHYTVNGHPGVNQGPTKMKGNYMNKRIKGRPPQLDEEWDEPEDLDSPPPYDNKRGQQTKPSRKGKSKVYVPPGESGESDTDVMHNPLYGIGLKQKDDDKPEAYNY